jgi:Lipocalin-like domain
VPRNSLTREQRRRQQKTLKELIVGTWLLDSVYDQYKDGKETNPWGPGVKGIAMYNANGWFSWQMMSADRSKIASNNPRDPVGQAIAHFGTYTVDEAAKTMSTHIERCTFPQWDGTDGTVAIAFPSDCVVSRVKPNDLSIQRLYFLKFETFHARNVLRRTCIFPRFRA